MLREALSARAQLATGVFHEELSTARRDTEVARFRADDGPSLLVSTEAGGEGRNFEFCHRLVLYDLPWKPSTVEQRIGRLDRIGRRMPGRDRLLPSARPASAPTSSGCSSGSGCSASRSPASSRSSRTSSARSRRSRSIRTRRCPTRASTQLVAAAQAARTRIHEAAYQQLHRDPYRAELGPAILARVPAGPRRADGAGRRQRRLAARLPRRAGARRGAPTRSSSATRRSSTACPASPAARRSSARSIASTRWRTRRIDFFASGHPLVEGLLAHFEEDPKGRVARLELQHRRRRAATGLVAIYKDGPEFEVAAFDADGQARPDWADAFRRRAAGGAEDEAGRRRRARLARARRPARAAARQPAPARGRGRRARSRCGPCRTKVS